MFGKMMRNSKEKRCEINKELERAKASSIRKT